MSSPGLRILIVEDQCLIAKQLEVLASRAGHVVVGTAFNQAGARALATSTGPDVVLIDLSLADGCTGVDLATFMIADRHAQVIFVTANQRRLPPDYCGAIGLVEKPFTRVGLVNALAYVAARLRRTSNGVSKPRSLHLSPTYAALWRNDQPGALGAA